LRRQRAAILAAALSRASAQIRFEELARKAGLRFELRNSEAGNIYFRNGARIPSLRKTSPEFYNRLIATTAT
jgi:hypothetical protein